MEDLATVQRHRSGLAAEILDLNDRLDDATDEYEVNGLKQKVGDLEADAKQLDSQIAKLEAEARKPAVSDEQLKKLYPTTPTKAPEATPPTPSDEPKEPVGIQSVYGSMEPQTQPKRPESMNRMTPDNELTPEELAARDDYLAGVYSKSKMDGRKLGVTESTSEADKTREQIAKDLYGSMR